jgi:hypothetical protein
VEPGAVALTVSRPLSKRSLLAFLAVAALGAFAGSLLRPWDPDAFHHLALGRHILSNGFFTGEPFLFPLLGQPSGVPPYWLGSVAIYSWERLAGVVGLAFLPALVAAVLAVVLVLDSAPRGGRHTWVSLAAAAPPVVLALLEVRYRAGARPEIFGTLLTAIVLHALRRGEEGDWRLLVAVPALALLWSNLHPSVAAGLGFVAVAVAVAAARLVVARSRAVPGSPSQLAREAGILLVVLVAATAATFANPSPSGSISRALRFAAAHFLPRSLGAATAGAGYETSVLAFIPEMGPASWHLLAEPAGILLLVTSAALLVRWRSAPAREALTVALAAWLTLGAARFAVLLAVVCAPIAARALGELAAALPERIGRVPARAAAACACALGAVAALPLALAEPMLCAGTELRPGAFPVLAADYLERLGFRGRLFNTFELGGYLSWRRVGPPYQDGRGALRPGEERAALAGTYDRASFAALDARYRFDALLLAYPMETAEAYARCADAFGATDWMADRSGWSLVAFDDGGLLYLRRDGAYAREAARDEYRVALPANANFAPSPEQVPLLLAEYRRAVREAPGCTICRYYLGVAALSLGLPEEARASVEAVPARACLARALPFDALRSAIDRASSR